MAACAESWDEMCHVPFRFPCMRGTEESYVPHKAEDVCIADHDGVYWVWVVTVLAGATVNLAMTRYRPQKLIVDALSWLSLTLGSDQGTRTRPAAAVWILIPALLRKVAVYI
jgi:hypothetical protein